MFKINNVFIMLYFFFTKCSKNYLKLFLYYLKNKKVYYLPRFSETNITKIKQRNRTVENK